MTGVFGVGAGRQLTLAGRSALEMASGREGGYGCTVRRVTIAPESGAPQRGPHRHEGCEEVMTIVSGTGELRAGDQVWSVAAGDVVVVSAGVLHRTRNTGSDDLVLLCVLPVEDVGAVTEELANDPQDWG